MTTTLDVNRIIDLAVTVRLRMDTLQRRMEGKPGHQNVTPRDMIRAARRDLDAIEELRAAPL